MLQHLIEVGEFPSCGPVDAVTQFSHEVGDCDRATEFESLGDRLIDLS